ncbi:hypothetical protein EIP86_008774 [Pleurotus ostreatoroseus]|nr:hypothetical protein EIP86_008774 [Pleurotus ostreatoroseus]
MSTSSAVDARCDWILRRRANDALPVLQLAPEILVDIFQDLRAEDIRDLWRGHWLAYTHVCHHWRTVAHAAPILWNHVCIRPETSEEALKAWLACSGTATVNVTIESRYDAQSMLGDDGFSDAVLECILPEMSRVETMQLLVSRKTLLALNWPIPAPLLTRLILSTMDHTASASTDGLLSLELRDSLPRLKTFTVSRFGFDFKHCVLPPTLTYLELSNPNPSANHTLNDILKALKHLPLIESLVLEDILPPRSVLDDPQDSVSFPSLKVLGISGPLHEQLALLNRIELGPSVRLRLHLVVHESFTAVESLFTSSFSRYLDQIPPLRAVLLYIQGDPSFSSNEHVGSCEFTFVAWDDPQVFDELARMGRLYGDEDARIDITFSVPEPTTEWLPLLSYNSFSPLDNLFSRFPLSHVQSLTVDCLSGPMLTAPLLWRRMNALQTLCLFGGRDIGEGLLGTLQRIDLAQGIEQRTIIFPKLQTLFLSRVPCGDALDLFREVLGERQQLQEEEAPSSARLKVVLKTCFGLTSSFIEDMETVAAVEWDGIEAQSYRELAAYGRHDIG